MNIPAFLREADMDLLDKLGGCKTKDELDVMLTEEGIEHSAADLGPLFAALTPMRSPEAADAMFKNFSGDDFQKMASQLQSMMSGAGKKGAQPAGSRKGGKPKVDQSSLNDLLTFLSNNKEK